MQTRKTDIEGWEMGAVAAAAASAARRSQFVCTRSMCSGLLTCRTLSRYQHAVFRGEIPFLIYLR